MKKARNLLITGIPGTGKSYDLGAEIEEMVLNDGYFVVLLDPKVGEEQSFGDHEGLSADLGFGRVHIDEEAVSHDPSRSFWTNLIEGARDEGLPGLRFTFNSVSPKVDQEMVELGDMISRVILSMDGQVGLAAEELHNFAPHQSRGGSTKDIRGLTKLIDEGRTINKAFAGATQKLTKVSTAIYGACNIFRMYHMGTSDSAYEKVLDTGENRELVDQICQASVESRRCLEYRRQTAEATIMDRSDLERVTTA